MAHLVHGSNWRGHEPARWAQWEGQDESRSVLFIPGLLVDLNTTSSPKAQNKDLHRAHSSCSENPFPPDQTDARKPRLSSKPEEVQGGLTMRVRVQSIHKARGWQ